MASKTDTQTKRQEHTSVVERSRNIITRTIYGRILSVQFFKRHWLAVFMGVMLIMIYISNKYSFQTRIEQVNSLRSELGVIRTEFIRERSMYMSAVRERAMRARLDSIGLNLTYQVQPPFRLSYGNEE